jgi:NAD/NADP transhydrogenase alpha subunit
MISQQGKQFFNMIFLISYHSQIPPCKVLVIGAGVAGLSAIVTVSLLSEIPVNNCEHP